MSVIGPGTLDGGTRDLGTAELEALANGMQGDLVRTDDAEYDEVRQIWNAMIDRRPGLTIDNLVSAEVVTADGERLTCDAQREPDLFWVTPSVCTPLPASNRPSTRC